MNKQEFLAQLKKGLSGLPQADAEERLAFYGEMIDDRMEEGLSEEEAVAAIGPIDSIVSQTISEIPITKLVKEKVRPKRGMRAWEIALLILGFPLWFPLLVTVLALVFTLYAVIWSLIVTLWAVAVSLIAGAVGGVAAGILLIGQGDTAQGLLLIGASLVLAGLSVFLIFGCIAATKGAVWMTKKIALWIKSLFLRKEDAE
jgi:uncharacterized membrane protein